MQMLADRARILDEAFVLDDLQHRMPHRARDRIAAEGVEIHGLGRELVEQRRAGDDARERMAVAERLAEGHEVRHRVVKLVPPHPGARAAEARLHLVSDVEAAGLAGKRDRPLDIACRHSRHALGREDRVEEDRGGPHAGLGHRGDGSLHVGCGLGGVHLGTVRHVDRADARVPALRRVERRAERGNDGGVPVVAEVGDDDALVARAGARDSERKLAGLGAGTTEHDAGEVARKGGGQRLGVVEDALVQIAGGEVEPAGLIRERVHHVRVAMAHVWHVVVGVEIDPAVAVPDPGPLPPHQMERPVVEERRTGAEQPVAAFEQRLVRHDGRPLSLAAGRDIG